MYIRKLTLALHQGRAGLVALRRSRGGIGAMGKAFYKGGFEPKMTKKEASLILSLRYALSPLEDTKSISHDFGGPLC